MGDRGKQSDDHSRHHSPHQRLHSRSPPSRRSRSRSRSPRQASLSPRSRDGGEDSYNSGNTLYVAGLSPRATEKELKEIFAKYGEVVSLNLVSDPRTKESRGFGFVKMKYTEEADAAIRNLNKTESEGRVLTVEKAKRGVPRKPTPGRYLGNDKFRGGRGSSGGGRGGYYHRDERRPYSGPPVPSTDEYYSYYRRYGEYPSNYYPSRYDPYNLPARSRSPGYFYPPSPRSRGSGYFKTSPRYSNRPSRSPSPRSVPYSSYRSDSRSPPRGYFRGRGPTEQTLL